MTERTGFSDQDLSAYLDDEAPADVAAAIEGALPDDPGLRARLDALRAAQDSFTVAMEAALASAPEMPDMPEPVAQTTASAWPFGLAGVAAGAVLALGVGWNIWHTPDPGWRDVIANYQSLYVTETLAPIDPTPEVQQAELQRLSAGVGIDLTGLPEISGLSFKRAQQLGFKGKPLAQLTFLAADGGPVALCILRNGAETSPGITAEVLSGLDTYSWTEDGFGILLVGPKGTEGLKNAAEILRDALKNTSV